LKLITMPIFFLPDAFSPLDAMSTGIRYVIYVGPLTYGVGGLRGALVSAATFPLWFDFSVLLVLPVVLAGLGAYFFSKMEVD